MKFAKTSILTVLALIAVPFEGQSQSNVNSDNEKLYQAYEYRNLGPTRGGRATAVAGHSEKPGFFLMGATGGGVWKTEDYGDSWQNISDGYFSTPSIGAIRVANSNPDIIYVGTGSDGIRSNVITGKGVFKSTDAGKSWSFAGLPMTGQIGAVEIHPSNPDIVFVAAIGQAFQRNKERGVYKTTDGGKTWSQVLYHSDSIGAVDLEFAPDNPDIIYATLWRAERKPWTIISGSKEGGIYKSIDGGKTWKKQTQGLPTGLIGKIDLAVTPADPEILYALVEAAPDDVRGLYKSSNRGESFELVSSYRPLTDRPFYYCNVDVNPQNPNTVYVNSTGFHYSVDSGKTWRRMRTPHGDNHDMWINPKDTLVWVQSNDGGANVTINYGKTWSSIENQPTAELYQVEVDDQVPYWLYAGQQDNSTMAVPSLPPYNHPAGDAGHWLAVGGCETGPAVPKPGNHNIVYSNCKGRFGVYDKRTGQERQYYVGAANMYGHNPADLKYRFQRVSPIHVSPHNPDVVYHTSQYVHKTTDDGITWETISPDLTAFDPKTQVISGSPITRDITGEEFYSTIYAIRESSVKAGVIWVGANDGPVHVTRNGGDTWEQVTPKGLAAGGRVDAVEPSPHKEGKAYIAVLRYQLGDWKPYAYRTTDFGKTWRLLTTGKNGIPENYPVRVVREDAVKEGLLFAGTEFGMFISYDDGETWEKFQRNLPVTPVTDIKIYRDDLILSTMGRGFWIMDNISSLRAAKSVDAVTLFKSKDTYRFRFRGSNSVPEYPSPGVVIDYYLAHNAKDEITLEIVDARQQIIRSFESETRRQSQDDEPSMATGFFFRGNPSSLEKTAGSHRFIWDMDHKGTWDSNRRRSFLNGPMAAPGEYQVRLIVDGNTYTQTVKLVIDPSLAASGITYDDLKSQEELTLKIRDLQDTAKRVGNSVQNVRKEIAKELKENSSLKSEDDKWAKIENQMFTADGTYMTPMLLDQISYLSSMLNRADQRPGKDAFDRYTELKIKFENILKEYLSLKETSAVAGDGG